MSRNLDFRTKTFRPFALALGEIALAWNDFHMVLSSLFGAVLKIPNQMVADAIWHSLTSDRAQREMLKAVVNLSVIGHDIPIKLREEINTVLSKATKLEDLRNDALHSPHLDSSDGSVFAWYQLGHKRATKLANKDLLKVYRWFYDSVIALREYTELLADCVRRPDEPLPQKLVLPNHGAPNEHQSPQE